MDNKQPISFESIGRDYRDNYAKYRKKRIVIQSIMSVIIALLITSFFLMCFLSAGYAKEDIFPICLLIFPLLVIAFVIILICMTLKRNKELKKSDEWLGKKYKFTNKRVKGSAFRRTLPYLIFSFSAGISILFFGISTLFDSVHTEPYSDSSLIALEGNVESINVKKNKISYIDVWLKDNETVFRIISDSYKVCDKDIKTDDIVGEHVYISASPIQYMDNSDDYGHSKYTYVYSFKTDKKTYLTYENYLASAKKDRQIATCLYYIVYVSGIGLCLAFDGIAIYFIAMMYKEDILLR